MSSQSFTRCATFVGSADRFRAGRQLRRCAVIGWLLVTVLSGTGCMSMSPAWRGVRGELQSSEGNYSGDRLRNAGDHESRSAGLNSTQQAGEPRETGPESRSESGLLGRGPAARSADRHVAQTAERRSLSDRDLNNPLRSRQAATEFDAKDVAAANYEAQAEDDPWGPRSQALPGSQGEAPPYDLETTSLRQDGKTDLDANPDAFTPINDWMERPEPLPLPDNDINTSDRRQATANLADSAEGHYKYGPGYQPQHLQQQSLSATEFALQLQREKKKLLEQIQQQINQELYLTKRLETESAAHAATRDELEKSRQLVARLSYEIKQLQADNAAWQQKHAQLEQRYRDYTRGVEQTLDEMLLQALAQQAKGGK